LTHFVSTKWVANSLCSITALSLLFKFCRWAKWRKQTNKERNHNTLKKIKAKTHADSLCVALNSFFIRWAKTKKQMKKENKMN